MLSSALCVVYSSRTSQKVGTPKGYACGFTLPITTSTGFIVRSVVLPPWKAVSVNTFGVCETYSQHRKDKQLNETYNSGN